MLDIAQFGVKEIDEARVLLNGVTSGKPIFALPPGTGDALGYLQVADKLRPYAFYGFNFIEAQTRIQDYVDLIREVEPEGPHLLFGYSAGGNLAYHITQALEQRGHCVSDIVMVDSARFYEKVSFSEAAIKKRAEQFLNHENTKPYLTNPILWEKAYRIIKGYHDYIAQSVDNHQVHANIHVLLAEQSQSIYRDSNISDRLEGVQLENRSNEATGRIVISVQGWAEVTTGQFKTYQGVGEHNKMLYQPYLDSNIQILREIFEQVD
ncbi:MAG: hypothetical protein DRR16_12240 [Candidatus Parabeggiatoa sp. nov. 3]|nr:MAG: hypothetical protein DRR00_18140 [Gammaproteobacteria bacterium]RKZ59771.1 MAG: hypothetical protein DRQ99_23190 [Gammaproteobacteria bacterium]RKZ85331.1 MAG: hypothetical protein DRR16_12240 [Gammaproteobacteria bacterium]